MSAILCVSAWLLVPGLWLCGFPWVVSLDSLLLVSRLCAWGVGLFYLVGLIGGLY